MIKFLLIVGVILMTGLNGQAWAEEPAQRNTFTLRVADPKLDADNGRTYTLKNSAVIEEIEISASQVQRNVFDFPNGVVYHERPNDNGTASYGTTSFNQLPAGRVEEIQSLGCQIASKSGMLVRNKDDVEYYRDHFCAKE